MPVGFGFSVGDFIGAANLINQIIKSLREIDGSASEYQHLVVELEALGRALNHVSALQPSASNLSHVNAIRGLALSCRLPLQEYLAKIQNYEPSMGSSAPKKALHGACHKLKWGIFVTKEVKNLRVLIVAKVVSINLLLAMHASQTLSELHSRGREEQSYLLTEVAKIRASTDHFCTEVQRIHYSAEKSATSTNDTLKEMHSKIDSLKKSMSSQTKNIESLAQSVQTSSVGLRDMYKQAVEFVTSFPSELRELLQKILALNFKIYNLLLHPQSPIKSPSLLLESNIRFEDALGRFRELPYEWFRYWEVFNGLLRVEFKDKPGESKVLNGHYHIMDVTRPNVFIGEKEWQQTVFPGSSLSMSMIISHIRWQGGLCPRPSCNAISVNDKARGSMITCQACGLRYYAYADDIKCEFQRVTVLEEEDEIATMQLKEDLELFGDRPTPLDPEEFENTETTRYALKGSPAPEKRRRSEEITEYRHKIPNLELLPPPQSNLNDIDTFTSTMEDLASWDGLMPEDYEPSPSPLFTWLEQTESPSGSLVLGTEHPPNANSDHIRELEVKELEVFRNVHVSASAKQTEAPNTVLELYNVEVLDHGSRIYFRNILDKFPNLPLYLARRLAEANRKRAERIGASRTSEYEGADQAQTSPCKETLPVSSSENASKFIPLPLEKEQRLGFPDDSGRSTSLPASAEKFKKVSGIASNPREIPPKWKIRGARGSYWSTTPTSADTASEHSMSSNSNNSLQTPDHITASSPSLSPTIDIREQNVSLPPPPIELGTLETFLCDICGEKVQVFKRREWQKHILQDLRPYICTFEGCTTADKTYATRMAFATHEQNRHATAKRYKCTTCSTSTFETKEEVIDHRETCIPSFWERGYEIIKGPMDGRDCLFCTRPIAPGLEPFANHVGQHLEEISVTILAIQRQEWKFYEDSCSSKSSTSSKSSRLASRLEVAAENGHTGSMRRILRNVSQYHFGRRCYALHRAAMCGHHPAVWLLLQKGAKVDERRLDCGWTALHEASAMGHLHIVRLLLQVGSDPNALEPAEETALELAVRRDHRSVVAELLASGAKVLPDVTRPIPWPFYKAIKDGSIESLRMLLGLTEGDQLARKMLAVAIADEDDDFTQLLLGYHMLIHKEAEGKLLEEVLEHAALHSRTHTVSLLLEQGAPVSRDAFFNAVQSEHAEIFSMLFERETPDSETASGTLHRAAAAGVVGIVRMILERGFLSQCDVTHATPGPYNEGRTPLSRAAENGHEEIVKLLLKTGLVNVDSADSKGRTPLSRAAENGHEDIVKLLLKTGLVNVDSADIGGRTPLWWAANNGHEAVVMQLLETCKVDFNTPNRFERTSIFQAAWKGHVAVVNLLLQTGKADVNSKDSRDRTLLSHAAEAGKLAVVQLLAETAKVNINAKDKEGRTPLSWAAYGGDVAVSEYLLTIDEVDVNSRDIFARTPLWLAAWKGHFEIVRLLVNKGNAGVNLADYDDRTPWRLATESGHTDIASFLDVVALRLDESDRVASCERR